MNVKLDTKEKFSVITPQESELTANMSAVFQELLLSFLENPIPHVILCLKSVDNIDKDLVDMILNVQSHYYEKNCSFIICEVPENLNSFFEDSLNITPTEIEAWYLLHMDEIERELMKDFE
jgi:anti-anti-sigma regulatory factor